MSGTYTESKANTFTISHARYLASKVETDLMRLHRYYYPSHNSPTLIEIKDYHDELVLLQKFNFLDEITYGFKLNGVWVKFIKYKATQGDHLITDNDPGGVAYSIISTNAMFSSFLTHNNNWNSNSDDGKKFLQETPIDRGWGTDCPGVGSEQKMYLSGGRGFIRSGN